MVICYGLSLLPTVLIVLSLINYASCAPNWGRGGAGQQRGNL